ncbi:hypothetical protein AGLY_007578 [Aphis glycines]|uniref:Uncharacterized protein n=1 Tax=Aphis glycines TaxID=307491 RepID=A0A6G0TMZ2_APHGL|nr:hypothetical protein AGLY_007578 [Aphis glycines]
MPIDQMLHRERSKLNKFAQAYYLIFINSQCCGQGWIQKYLTGGASTKYYNKIILKRLQMGKYIARGLRILSTVITKSVNMSEFTPANNIWPKYSNIIKFSYEIRFIILYFTSTHISHIQLQFVCTQRSTTLIEYCILKRSTRSTIHLCIRLFKLSTIIYSTFPTDGKHHTSLVDRTALPFRRYLVTLVALERHIC